MNYTVVWFLVFLKYLCLLWVWVWLYFFFFKQKTAYEMRISDWSSDVCSSDLRPCSVGRRPALVCGLASRPYSSRSCITLRMEAGERLSAASFDSVRDPTGCPVSR